LKENIRWPETCLHFQIIILKQLMMRRKVNDKEDKDQSASDSRHDSEETYSGHENASGKNGQTIVLNQTSQV